MPTIPQPVSVPTSDGLSREELDILDRTGAHPEVPREVAEQIRDMLAAELGRYGAAMFRLTVVRPLSSRGAPVEGQTPDEAAGGTFMTHGLSISGTTDDLKTVNGRPLIGMCNKAMAKAVTAGMSPVELLMAAMFKDPDKDTCKDGEQDTAQSPL